MREIKFRAWDKQASAMRLVKSVNYADDGFAGTVSAVLVGSKYHVFYVHGESCELMQYTGLNDKKGKEIYEGDILRIEEWKMNGEVNFASGMFKVRDRTRENFNPSLASFMVEVRCEVIGNIYENPELLAVMDA